MKTPGLGLVPVLLAAVIAAGCGDNALVDLDGNLLCSLDPDLLVSILPPDAIPALTLPEMVSPDDPGAQYLFDFDRVLGVVVNGEARAYPHNILWHHEIVREQQPGDAQVEPVPVDEGIEDDPRAREWAEGG